MVQELIAKYARRGVLVDTNILLLYFIGNFDQKLIGRFKRTIQFAEEDFETLLYFLERFQIWATTPTILAEVNSLSGQLGEPARSLYFATLEKQFERLEETYVKSSQVAAHDGFIRFGLTDCSIASNAIEKYLVLTDDFRLSQYLQHLKIDVINFNHIRTQQWT